MRKQETPAYKKLEVALAATSSIIPYSLNNRVHSDQQVDRIANSIAQFGFNQPIVTDENNVILVGHGRLEAAKKLGLEQVPVLKKADLTETQKKAYRILDNKLQNDSTWDLENLELELDALTEGGFDLKPWGLDELAGMFVEEPIAEDDDFEVPDANEVETAIKKGDLIELGRHRLLCGDSTSQEDTSRLAAGEAFDLLLTDPPYNVDYTGGTKDALKIANDSMADADFRQFLTDAFQCAFHVLKPGASFYIWHADLEGYNFRGAVHDIGQKVRQCLIWHKNTLVMGRQDYQWKHEPCLYGWKDGASHGWYSDRTQTTVLPFDKPRKNAEHPTMKPIPLFAYLLGNSTAPQGVVYDPFLGSGTSLIAAEQLGRTCYGMEISPQYCQVIVDRYKAHCDKAGKPFQCKINGEDVSKYISDKGAGADK
jgi:DNA modification methylase